MANAEVNLHEYERARTSWGQWRNPSRALLSLAGADIDAFAQAMTTNDLRLLEQGGMQYSTLLTGKGAMVSDVRVARRGPRLYLDVPVVQASAVVTHLQRYIVSEDVEVSAEPAWQMVSFLGPAREARVAEIPHAAIRLSGPVTHQTDLWFDGTDSGAANRLLESSNSMSQETYEVVRVEDGVPRWGAELTETTIPLEANLGHAIHMSKGCYLGQEVIARATYRGHMNRGLVGVVLEEDGGKTAQPGAELLLAGKKVGWLTSVVKSPTLDRTVALGYLRLEHGAAGSRVDVAGGGAAVVHGLPFVASQR